MKHLKTFCTLVLSLSLVATTALFPALALKEPTSVVYGDLDKNGTINAADALVVLKMAVSEELIEDLELIAAADVTGDVLTDGEYWYDAADALEILKYAVGKIKVFPAEKLDPYTKPAFAPDGVLTAGQEVDFVFEFPAERRVKVVVFSDIHLAYSSSHVIWPYIEESLAKTMPDLIILNGDNVHGDYDYTVQDDLTITYGEKWQEMCDTMDSYRIPWLFNFGNHERTGAHDLDWMVSTIRASKYGKIATNDCTGTSNYSVAIKQGDEYTQILYLVDTNGSGATNKNNPDKDKIQLASGVFPDQQLWLQRTNFRIEYDLGEQIPSTMFSHEAPEFVNGIVASKYPDISDECYYNSFEAYQPGDYGWLQQGTHLPFGQQSSGLYNVIKEIGCRDMVFAHNHGMAISFTDPKMDLRFSWGLKTGWSVGGGRLNDGRVLSGVTLLTLNPQTKRFDLEYVFDGLPAPDWWAVD